MSEIERSRLALGAEMLTAHLAQHAPHQAVDCDVLVVGSGYGGAVAAARLAGATVIDKGTGKPRSSGAPAPFPSGDGSSDPGPGQAVVWVLERGLEFRPGSFPSRFGDLPGQVRFSRQDGRPARGQFEGLFDVRLGDDVNVLLGNGLGGGSLINAGVMEQPRDEVFESGWPTGMNPPDAELLEGYRLANAVLAPDRLPESDEIPPPAKLVALRALAAGKNATPDGPDRPFSCRIAVSFDTRPSVAGVAMAACTRCGDCITGCNQGAKRTLDTNYLAWARRAGAGLFCGGWVERVERDVAGAHWIVHWHYTAEQGRPADGSALRLRARHVVLAAGSLGSTEILLRSRSETLTLSNRLGERFSTNGDQIVALFRQKIPVHASREEDLDPALPGVVGPTICGLVREQCDVGAIAVEEFAVPAALKRVMGEVTTTFGLLQAIFKGPPEIHAADKAEGDDELGVSRASLEYTSILGVMGDDHARGRMSLVARAGDTAADAAIRLHWPRVDGGLAKLFEAQCRWLKDACDGEQGHAGPGGTVVPNPTWSVLPADLHLALDAPAGSATTVHPLGGCAMADDAGTGVVDRRGRVFDGQGSTHSGLAVLDGAIVPRALAINPALTIAALAEQAVPRLAKDWGLKLAGAETAACGLPPPTRMPAGWQTAQAPAATGFRIREQMHGTLQIGGHRCWAELEVPALEIDDLAAMLRRRARVLHFPTAPANDANETSDWRPRLRLFSGGRGSQADAEARLSGSLSLFEPYELPPPAAAMAAVEGMIVALERMRSRQQSVSTNPGAPQDWMETLAPLVGLLRTLGQGRRLVYTLRVDDVSAEGIDGLRVGSTIRGTKTIAFSERGNPWQQLMEMDIELQPAQDGAPLRRAGRLTSDLGYFAKWRELLGSLTAQRDHPTALADLAGLVLLTARILMFTHWPHFIPPGDMPQRIGQRRPGRLDGMRIERHELGLEGAFLTRYPFDGAKGGRHPLLMIHGLSAAGSTFAHPSVPDNLVCFMHRQGRDVWVLELRTSSSREPRPQGAYRFEDAATADIPQAIDRIFGVTQCTRVDVVAHCIGAAMFCLAVLHRDQGLLHERIGRAVLSQVGPHARMSAFNRFRGYVAGFLEDYLGLDELDVRPEYRFDETQQDWLADQPGGTARLLLDALLASFPYPEDDQEAARAAALTHRHGPHSDFRRVRHRADAIIGQTMQLQNVGDETLLSLDAIYGYVKSRTLAQTIHIAREGVLTSADGINATISGAGLAQRLDFPLLLLHGERNEVFDWQGSLESWRALVRAFGEDAGDSLEIGGDRLWGAGTRRQMRLLRRYGHQDTLIGKDASREVFPCIEDFLAATLPDAEQAAQPSRYACDMPWMGPLLGWLRADDVGFEVSVLVHAGARRAVPCCVVLVPVRDGQTVAAEARGFRLGEGPQREALLDQPLQLRFAATAALPLSYAVLVLYREQQDEGQDGDDFIGDEQPGPGPLQGGFALDERAGAEVRRFLNEWRGNRDDLRFTIDASALAAADRRTPTKAAVPLSFAVGSCQFPPALFDKMLAGGASRVVRNGNGKSARLAPPQFQLLLGDLVYLDALGNVFESPGRTPKEVARRAWESGWRLRPFRQLAQQLPLYPMLDDHEVVNDWQPAVDGSRNASEQAALVAYDQHGGKLAPQRLGAAPSYSYVFAPAGLPFFVLDTRTRRKPRHVGGVPAVEQARIVHGEDMAALKRWLLDNRDAPVKFVASPSFVLPVERPELGVAERGRLDGWSGYPASQCELLGFIDHESIHGVVFLSGDAHLSAVTTFTFAGSGLQVVSIVSSGMYTPWPFVNARPQDLLLDGPVVIECDGATIRGRSVCDCLSTVAGFAIVQVVPQGHGATLLVELRPARGPVPPPEVTTPVEPVRRPRGTPALPKLFAELALQAPQSPTGPATPDRRTKP